MEEKKRPFAVFDIDGTLIRWQLYHSLVDELARTGYIKKSEYRKVKESRMTWKRREHKSTFAVYRSTLVEVFHDALKTLPPSELDSAAEKVFETYKDQVYTYTRDLIARLKDQGYVLFAISGSQHEIITRLATYYGFDDAVGNQYERAGEKLTGEHQHVVENKPKVLKGLMKKYNVEFKNSIAIGDSGSDASLLELVDHPVAFNPDQTLFEIATGKKWPIIIERKNVIYELRSVDGSYQLCSPNSR